MGKPQTVDAYLAGLSDDKRAALERLRRIIRAAAPGSEECISYGIPAFRLAGKGLVWFGAGANHCAIYGVGTPPEVAGKYDTSGKGTIRFQPDDPLPAPLVRKLVKARIAKNAAREKAAPAGVARRRSSRKL
jgi:uncharacterized protein YdhG (YjbR/CyaY superfamily)